MIAAALFGALIAAGLPADDLAADARAAYDKTLRGELEAAEKLYASVIERGGRTADLYCNLGTVQLERGAHVEAVVSFVRALELDPAHANAQANLRAAQSQLGAETEERAPSWRDLLPFLGRVNGVVWGGLFVLGNALLAAAVALRRARIALAIAGVVLLTVSTGALGLLARGRGQPMAIVETTRPMRAGPAPRYAEGGTVRAGTSVQLGERREAWAEIIAPDGRRGWMKLEHLVVP